MATPVQVIPTFYRPGEMKYGTLLSGAFTNTDYDLVLEPGRWAVTLFMNANGVSGGAMTVRPLMPDGTAAEVDAPELYGFQVGNSTAQSFSFADHISFINILQTATGTTVLLPGNSGFLLWGGLRFTVSAIAGASASNRLWFVAVRV